MQSCRQPRTRPRGADDAAVDAALDPVVGAHLDDPRRQELRGVADFEARGEDRRRATDIAISADAKARSEERRVGEGCVSTCRSGWSPDHSKIKPESE